MSECVGSYRTHHFLRNPSRLERARPADREAKKYIGKYPDIISSKWNAVCSRARDIDRAQVPATLTVPGTSEVWTLCLLVDMPLTMGKNADFSTKMAERLQREEQSWEELLAWLKPEATSATKRLENIIATLGEAASLRYKTTKLPTF